MKEDQLQHITTNPDSSAYKAAKDLHQANVTYGPSVHQIDTRHLFTEPSETYKKEKLTSEHDARGDLKIKSEETKQLCKRFNHALPVRV